MKRPTRGRLSTGVPGLDALLGGGLLPGTLTVVLGATGIGKTQLGLQFLAAGQAAEGRPGLLFDLTSRGDSQNHADYAQRLLGRRLATADPAGPATAEQVLADDYAPGEYLNLFGYQGRRVTRRDLSMEDWQEWQAELARKLQTTIAFFYGNFIRGGRRAVIDGIEPADRASESIQLELFEYVYHQILRKDADWVARDLLRERYRELAPAVAARRYESADVACLLLYTSKETLLDALLERPLEEGDLLANANTILCLGKVREGGQFRRALHVAKHRGSAASDAIVPYTITDRGLVVGPA